MHKVCLETNFQWTDFTLSIAESQHQHQSKRPRNKPVTGVLCI